jgi:hypothetical protein
MRQRVNALPIIFQCFSCGLLFHRCVVIRYLLAARGSFLFGI